MKEVDELQHHWEGCKTDYCPICVLIWEAAKKLRERKDE